MPCAKGLHAEEYHYTAMGRVTSKTMKVTRKYPSNPDLPEPKELTASMAMGYTYNQGTAAQTTYPTTFTQPLINQPWNTVVGPRFEYSYDAMWRLAGETKADWNPGTLSYGTPASLVSGVTYNFNSQLTAITMPNGIYGTVTETRQYNGMLQLSRLTAVSSSNGTQLDEEYKYSATQNDGRLTSLKNWQSGEEVVYQYDSLQRLASAVTVGPEWGMSWVYDGFGNRTAQNVVKGSVPVQSISVDMNTNRVTSWSYDANGNATSIPGVGTITYDASNRVKTVGGETYEYDPSNKRTWKNDTFTFWGGRGERVGTYSVTLMSDTTGSPTQWKLAFVKQTEDWYFGGRRLNQIQDRLGSERSGKSYYPYGEERVATANPADKFATYHRDGTGLDYADQRYYASGSGRFVGVDWMIGSARSSSPVTWNRFSYTNNDPANNNDPSGLVSLPACFVHDGRFTCSLDGASYTSSQYQTAFQGALDAVAEAGSQAAEFQGGGFLECRVQVRYTQIKLPGWDTPFNHASIGVSYHIRDHYGVIHDPQNVVYDVHPSPVLVFPGSIGFGFVPTIALTMAVSGTPNGRYNHWDDATYHWGAQEYSTSQCALAANIVSTVQGFTANGPWFYGTFYSNSNSFVSHIMRANGVSIGPPPNSPGWNTVPEALRGVVVYF